MRLLIVPALLFLVSQQGDEAKKLFDSAGKKIADAKAVGIGVRATLEVGDKKGKLGGTIRLAKGNKNRTQLSAEFGDKEVSLLVVSNGEKMKLEGSFAGKAQLKDTPKEFNASLATGIHQAGVMLSTMATAPGGKKAEGIAERFKVADFALGNKEKVGKHEAQVVKYKLKMKGEVEIIDVELWLTTDTLLPLKRVLTGKTKTGERANISETYDVMLNPKEEPDLFSIPD